MGERNVVVKLTEREAQILLIISANSSNAVFGWDVDRPLFSALGIPEGAYTDVPHSQGLFEHLREVWQDPAFKGLIRYA